MASRKVIWGAEGEPESAGRGEGGPTPRPKDQAITEFAPWFERVTGQVPHPWQRGLGSSDAPATRLIRVPTGFGKTRGALLAWLFHSVARGDVCWPRRLVWCLPMRVLVEQTHAEVTSILRAEGRLWQGGAHEGKVGVHLLMGGADAGDWVLYPEECAVLIGTQDMLLSRALNRGYGASRASWPAEFGLLHHDCLWVMDEVQLMDVGLATSAQLQAFRADAPSHRPTATWWMSATLQRSWLRTRDAGALADAAELTSIPEAARRGRLWDDVTKPCALLPGAKDAKALADRVLAEHLAVPRSSSGPTLVVVNTVERAMEVFASLQASKRLPKSTELRLIHSRFRPAERAGWREAFLHRDACTPGTDRIIVATQVVEAGVDVSASVLVTDLAPWPSLVQRFGRAARWGGTARIFVADTEPKDDKGALPYTKEALDASRAALSELADVSPRTLEAWEEGLPGDRLASLYPYEPEHILLRHELDELFDTSPDLGGADLDVSRFIRSGEERDVQVFWAEVPEREAPARDLRPTREALCAVPFIKAKTWLCGDSKRLQKRRSAWVWDFGPGTWREAEARDVYPGQTLLVDAAFGGYDWDPSRGTGLGWSPKAKEKVPAVSSAFPSAEERSDAAQDDESLSVTPYRTIATHGAEAGELAASLAGRLAPAAVDVLRLAAQVHDLGKAHPAFQGSMRAPDRPDRQDLAKAPPHAWSREWLYRLPSGERRPGLRHELASALALFAVLARHRPAHGALLGPWADLLAAMGDDASRAIESSAPIPLEERVLALEPRTFDLVAYLVASHHGKVRVTWHATPADQRASLEAGRVTLRGIRDGDRLPELAAPPEGIAALPEAGLDLSPSALGISPRTGQSWADRVLGLLREHGPFLLAWLEALLRAADRRASRIATPDPLLAKEAP